jgi:hypothetical protein
MKKITGFLFVLVLASFSAFAQLIDEKNVTVTMDLQPILQLNMTTPDQIDFVFDEIRDYYSGIIKYGATVLKVSASVSWDLYAVGTSTNGTFWDQQMTYGNGSANAIDDLPLSALELHQTGANSHHNTAVAPFDYSNQFISGTLFNPLTDIGLNSIYYSATPYTPPAVGEKYIQGMSGTAAALTGQGAPGGSYLTATPAVGTFSDYYFVIDYRIVPSLPAVFPYAGQNDGTSDAIAVAGAYARPGVYTMNVKYVLLEDQ